MKYLCVCHEKRALSPPKLSTKGAKWDARLAVPAVCRLWPSDDYDEDDLEEEEEDDVDDDDDDNEDEVGWGWPGGEGGWYYFYFGELMQK